MCYQVLHWRRTLKRYSNCLKLNWQRWISDHNRFLETDLRQKRWSRHVRSMRFSLLIMECIFCIKNKYDDILLQNLVKCLDNHVVESTKNAASICDNHYVKELMSTQVLIACKDHYHLLCYKSFIRHKTCTVEAGFSLSWTKRFIHLFSLKYLTYPFIWGSIMYNSIRKALASLIYPMKYLNEHFLPYDRGASSKKST